MQPEATETPRLLRLRDIQNLLLLLFDLRFGRSSFPGAPSAESSTRRPILQQHSRASSTNVGSDCFLLFPVAKSISCRRLDNRVCHGSCLASILRSAGFWAFVIRVPNERKGSVGGADYSYACNMGLALPAGGMVGRRGNGSDRDGENGGSNERTKRQAKLESSGESWQEQSQSDTTRDLVVQVRLCGCFGLRPSENSGAPHQKSGRPEAGNCSCCRAQIGHLVQADSARAQTPGTPAHAIGGGRCRTRKCQMRQ
jgi:hypothetical protein